MYVDFAEAHDKRPVPVPVARKKKRRGKKPPEHAPHLPKNQRRTMADRRRHMTSSW